MEKTRLSLSERRARENTRELQARSEGFDRQLRDVKRRLENIEEDIHSIRATIAKLAPEKRPE